VLPEGKVESDAKLLVIRTPFLKTMLDAPLTAGKYDIFTISCSEV
jgi:hypothetical protein